MAEQVMRSMPVFILVVGFHLAGLYWFMMIAGLHKTYHRALRMGYHTRMVLGGLLSGGIGFLGVGIPGEVGDLMHGTGLGILFFMAPPFVAFILLNRRLDAALVSLDESVANPDSKDTGSRRSSRGAWLADRFNLLLVAAGLFVVMILCAIFVPDSNRFEAMFMFVLTAMIAIPVGWISIKDSRSPWNAGAIFVAYLVMFGLVLWFLDRADLIDGSHESRELIHLVSLGFLVLFFMTFDQLTGRLLGWPEPGTSSMNKIGDRGRRR